MDQVVVSMHFLCKFFNVEEQRGRAGEGNWRNKLCDEHQHYELASDHFIIDDNEFQSPEEIVKFVIESATEKILPQVEECEESSSDQLDYAGDEEHSSQKDKKKRQEQELKDQGMHQKFN